MEPQSQPAIPTPPEQKVMDIAMSVWLGVEGVGVTVHRRQPGLRVLQSRDLEQATDTDKRLRVRIRVGTSPPVPCLVDA